jgi:hypothetical protein
MSREETIKLIQQVTSATIKQGRFYQQAYRGPRSTISNRVRIEE